MKGLFVDIAIAAAGYVIWNSRKQQARKTQS
jgi:hypothetical protein